MFDLANNRLSYSELLHPQVGYELDFAIGMTYSLDLEALLGVPVSLGLIDIIDEANLRNPLYVLEAIRKSSDRIAIFCNAGNICLPNHIESVYSLLENSVFEIKLPNRANFHPKLWILKYSRPGQLPYIKLLVMSRNLTFDNSIDISVSLSGEIGDQENSKNQPLADMLTFAAGYAGKKKSQVLSLAEDVMKVSEFETAMPFGGYDFYPMGIPGYTGNDNPLLGKKQELFAVSPFLSNDIVQRMTDFPNREKRCLITRKSAVTAEIMEAFNNEVYVTKDLLSDNEFNAKHDIHAKIYYVTTRLCNYLYLGSANASYNAFSRNVEFLLRLSYKSRMGFLWFKDDFMPTTDTCPYEKLEDLPEGEKPDPQVKAVENAFREAVYALKRAEINPDGNRYKVQVRSKALKTKECIKIAPLQKSRMQLSLTETVVFTDLLLKELSEFYILSIGSQSLIVKLPTKGMPKERDQEIYRSIISSKEQFMNYLSFMLSGDPAELTADWDILAGTAMNSGKGNDKKKVYVAVYEKLLQVFHQNPGRIKEIDDMIRRLDKKVIEDDFLKMYHEFQSAVRKVRR